MGGPPSLIVGKTRPTLYNLILCIASLKNNIRNLAKCIIYKSTAYHCYISWRLLAAGSAERQDTNKCALGYIGANCGN